MLAEIEVKANCRCDGGEIHGHCLTDGCDTKIEQGGWQCSACKERETRRRSCRECSGRFYLPAVREPEAPWYYGRGCCSERCYETRLDKRLEWADLPARYRKLTLDNFHPYTRSLENKLAALRGWCKRDLASGLFLFGNVGSGKTHLAAGVMRELFCRGREGKFVNVREFVMRCQSAFHRNETAAEIVAEILDRQQFLVLDDLGSEKGTEYVRQSLLHLVDEAYTWQKTLIVTSNLSLDQLGEFEPRLASRLAEMCDLYEFTEPDYRVRLAKQRADLSLERPIGGVM